MSIKLFFILVGMAAFAAVPTQANDGFHVRHVTLQKDQIVAIKTSVGIATLIQVGDRPTTAIIGDTEAFKLEYLDSGVTIKPLHGGARTNLYIYTDSQRFSIHLIPSPKESADYIVYLKTKSPPPKPEGKIRWRSFLRSASGGGLTLNILKIGAQAGSDLLFVNFELQSQKPIQLKPEWFWILQNIDYKPIENLFLSKLSTAPREPAQGTLTFRATEFKAKNPLRLELRGPKTISILLPEVNKWLK